MRRVNQLRFFVLVFSAVTMVLHCCPTTDAQQVQIQSFQFQNSAGGEQGENAIGLSADAITSGVASIAVAGPEGLMSLGGVDPSSRSQLFDLLSNESIRRELQLSDEQIEGVRQISGDSAKRLKESLQNAMIAGGGVAKFDIGQLMKERQAEAELAIEEILRPDQLKRVQQLAYQIEVSNVGLGESLVNGRLGRDVGVYEDQKQHLTDRARAIEEELRLAIAQAHATARAKLFAELTPEQRKEAESLLGDYFQYEQQNLQTLLRDKMNAKAGQAKPTQAK